MMRLMHLILLLLLPALSAQQTNNIQEITSSTIDEKAWSQTIESHLLLQIITNNCQAGPSLDMHSQFLTLSAAVLITMLSLLIFLYLLSYITDSVTIRSVVQYEFYSVFMTTFLLFALLEVLYLTINPVYEKLGIQEKAFSYSNKIVVRLFTTLGAFSGTSLVLSAIESLRISISFRIVPFSFSASSFVKPMTDSVGFISQLTSLAVTEWLVKAALLCLMFNYSFPLLIPIGLFLRAIPIFRGAGNSIIAASLGFFFIFPLLLAVNDDIDAKMSLILRERETMDRAVAVVKDVAGDSAFSVNNATGEELSGWLEKLYNLLFRAIFFPSQQTPIDQGGIWLWEKVFYPLFILRFVYYFFVLSAIFPFINISVLIAAIKEIGQWLDADVKLDVFMRLI
ncbi:MAG: hypothetical protein QW035_02875 [Candidatus Anstonellales archaeon]